MRATQEQRDAELRQREQAAFAEGRPIGTKTAPAADALDAEALLAIPGVQALVSAAVAAAVTQLSAARAQAGTVDHHGTDRGFAENLALAIANIADQGKPHARRTVAPEIMAAREAARDRMMQRILDARAHGVEPLYQLKNTVYLDEQKITSTYLDPASKRSRPRVIAWPGVPNDAMQPVNDAARGIFAEFLASISSSGARAAGAPVHTGLRVIDHDPDAATTGAGQGGQRSLVRGEHQPGTIPDPVHILGTVAQPAKPWNPGDAPSA